MTNQQVGVPKAARQYIRKIFEAANKQVSSLFTINPNQHEPHLDAALLTSLASGPSFGQPGGWTIYLETHFLGGRAHFYSWEIADIAFLLVFREGGKVVRIKVALLQSKRLYAKEQKSAAAPTRFGMRFNTLLTGGPAAFQQLVAGRSFSFDSSCAYEAVSAGSEQEHAISAYEKLSGIPVYYLFYNPPVIPLTVTLPAVRARAVKPIVGCRVMPAEAVSGALANRAGQHPTYGDLTTLPSFDLSPDLAGWRLENFVDELLQCHRGYIADSDTDHVLQRLLYDRSGPIMGTIAITIDAPPDTKFVLPDKLSRSE